MEALTIEQFNFNKDEVSLLSSTRYKNFPIVYILHNKKLSKPKAYIGQSVQVRNRLNNHLSDKEKRNLDQALVIAHDHFNQSATYNIETKLINYFIADQKYAQMALKLGLRADNVKQGVQSMIDMANELNNMLNIPHTFKDAGVDEQEFLSKIDLIADRAFEDQCTTANPRVPLVSEMKQILLKAYYGR